MFLSHAGADKPLVRTLGTHLQAVGAEVFFDEWSIAAGESISGAIEDALEVYDVFVLLWSQHAKSSAWARREYKAAVKTFVEAPDRKVIVVRLDETQVPALVADLRWVDLRDEASLGQAVNMIMGFRDNADRIKAMQAFLAEGDLEVREFPGYGAAVGCPTCGAGVGALTGWAQTDYSRDDQYAGVRCTRCGWEDGGEL
jgi:DNA-directed RNA polymerase subunit RPC12/RpoP